MQRLRLCFAPPTPPPGPSKSVTLSISYASLHDVHREARGGRVFRSLAHTEGD